jgi:hypothetical protein
MEAAQESLLADILRQFEIEEAAPARVREHDAAYYTNAFLQKIKVTESKA